MHGLIWFLQCNNKVNHIPPTYWNVNRADWWKTCILFFKSAFSWDLLCPRPNWMTQVARQIPFKHPAEYHSRQLEPHYPFVFGASHSYQRFTFIHIHCEEDEGHSDEIRAGIEWQCYRWQRKTEYLSVCKNAVVGSLSGHDICFSRCRGAWSRFLTCCVI